MPSITVPSYRERLLFLGANGSGKTTLARKLLDHVERYVVLDSKGDFPATDGDKIIKRPDDSHIEKNSPDRIIVRPGELGTSGAWLSHILQSCYRRAQREGKRSPFVVYVDEALYLAKTGRTQWLSALAVSGRSIGVGLWCSSQRPKWIPLEIKSEAWRWYIFYLGYEEDEKEVMKYSKGQLTIPELQRSTRQHAFIEMRRSPGRAGAMDVRRFPPVRQ